MEKKTNTIIYSIYQLIFVRICFVFLQRTSTFLLVYFLNTNHLSGLSERRTLTQLNQSADSTT